MINAYRYSWTKYCREPLEQIENFKAAEADNFAGWCIHHRLEIQPDGTRVSAKELIDKDLYFHRPASELVFMIREEHLSLHSKGKHLSAEHRQKIAEANSGENNPLFGKHHSTETRQKMSEAHKGKHHSEETRQKNSLAHKGENNPLFGKHHSEETRLKMSEANKGMLWWNNGISNKRSRECPGEGWSRGKLMLSI